MWIYSFCSVCGIVYSSIFWGLCSRTIKQLVLYNFIFLQFRTLWLLQFLRISLCEVSDYTTVHQSCRHVAFWGITHSTMRSLATRSMSLIGDFFSLSLHTFCIACYSGFVVRLDLCLSLIWLETFSEIHHHLGQELELLYVSGALIRLSMLRR